MRIVYFHGWGGHYNEVKAKILAKFGDEVYFPEIDYSNSRNLIQYYYNELCGNTPQLIVGTSLGGYLGFYVSNLLKCPSLLINPALFLKGGVELRPSTDSMSHNFKEKEIIFSGKDEEIDVKRCIKSLKELGYDKQIKIYDHLTHQIPIDVFENCFTEFREKYKDFKPEIQELKKSKPSYKSKDDLWEAPQRVYHDASAEPNAVDDREAILAELRDAERGLNVAEDMTNAPEPTNEAYEQPREGSILDEFLEDYERELLVRKKKEQEERLSRTDLERAQRDLAAFNKLKKERKKSGGIHL